MIVLISDLHLRSSKQVAYKLLEKMANTILPKASELYILGDLFDMWLGDEQINQDPEIKTISSLISNIAKQKNLSVFIMRGNRDICLSASFGKIVGCKILPDEFVINAFGNKYLLMHGDTLCTTDKCHVRSRAVVVFLYHGIGLKYIFTYGVIKYIANKLKNKAKKSVQTKTAIIMDVEQVSVDKVMHKHKVDCLIHGHTHKPNEHNYISTLTNTNKKRIVLGSWDNNNAVYCVIDKTGASLQTISLN